MRGSVESGMVRKDADDGGGAGDDDAAAVQRRGRAIDGCMQLVCTETLRITSTKRPKP